MRSLRTAVGAATLATLALGACGGGDGRDGGSTPAATSTVVSSVPASTTTASSTGAGSTTSVAPEANGDGALLTEPTSPTVKPVPATSGCDALVDDGYFGSCRLLTAPSGTIAFVSERPKGTTDAGEVRVLVWRQGTDYSLALRWADQVDTRQEARPSLRTIDLAQDGDPKLVVVFYEPGGGSTGNGAVQAIDVVEASGVVTLHRSLDHGVARQATGGGLETWSRVGASGSDRFRHEVIRYQSDAWRVDTAEEVPAEAVPRQRDDTTF
jgi:hypothetical protein